MNFHVNKKLRQHVKCKEEGGILCEKILFDAYESRRSSQSMRLATSGLPIAKRGAAETFHRHLDEIFDTGMLQDILLRGVRLENYIVGEYFRFFVAAARKRIALQDKEYLNYQRKYLYILANE